MPTVLVELSAGFALIKGKEGKQPKLLAWQAFKDTKEALRAANSLVEGKLGKSMKKFLQKKFVDAGLKEQLIVLESKLGKCISDELKVPVIWAAPKSPELELFRTIRAEVCSLIDGLTEEALRQTSLGLAHTLDRHRLKFSVDKLDVMVIHGIALLDELDKDLNMYAMRVKEWYGWHFPEMQKLVPDNLTYTTIAHRVGKKVNFPSVDISDLIGEEAQEKLRSVAHTSMGLDIAEDDVANLRALCDEVIASAKYRAELAEYLRTRMMTLAPNLTVMVGEIVGARLLAAAGSLINLAKAPSSTLQILGAEKALFRALKVGSHTPKYGLLYHASLVGRAPAAHRGKVARTLAARASLCARMDAFCDVPEGGEVDAAVLGTDSRAQLENRLATLEARLSYSTRKRDSGTSFGRPSNSYDRSASKVKPLEPTIELSAADAAGSDSETPPAKKEKKEKKEKKRATPPPSDSESDAKPKKVKKQRASDASDSKEGKERRSSRKDR